MKMSWSPEGDLQFGVFREKWQQLKYVGKESTHTPGTLRYIPSGILNRLAKITSRNPSIHAEAVDKIYPAHANALRKAGLAPPVLPTMGDLWRKQDEKVDIEKEQSFSKKKQKRILLCCILTLLFYVNPQGGLQAKKSFNLTWLRVRMSYHRFNKVAELLNGDLAARFSRQGIR